MQMADLEVLGEGLVCGMSKSVADDPILAVCGSNEGDVVWDEGEAGDYVNQRVIYRLGTEVHE